MSNEIEPVIVTGVAGCARCNHLHNSVIFVKMRQPSDGYTHWAMCPHLNEPILLQVTDEGSVVEKRDYR